MLLTCLVALVLVLVAAILGVLVRRTTPDAPPEAVGLVIPPPAEPMITIRYITAGGQFLGEQQLPKRLRRSTRRYKAGLFMASHQANDGAWVYRYCHSEREH